jgi:excinuclease ABC subunit A
MPALSTQLFSFNNPQGACQECGGLGVKQFFDLELIIPEPHKSIADGAIIARSKRMKRTHSMQMLASLAKHYDFSLNTPFKNLPEKI